MRNNVFDINLLFFFIFIYTHVTMGESGGQRKLQQSILSFYHAGSGFELRSAGMAASFFIH